MDIITKGSKPVIYKSNMRLKFYSGAIEDSRVAVNRIFTKFIESGSAVVYGEYETFLLFSYLNTQNHKEYITEQKSINFCEEISCRLPDAGVQNVESQDSNAGTAFDAHTTFEPRISCTAGKGGFWNITVEGQFDVLVYGDKTESDIHLPVSDIAAKSNTENATVVQLKDNSISANELLDMDTESIKNMTNETAASNDDEDEV